MSTSSLCASGFEISANSLLEISKSLIADELKTLRCDPQVVVQAADWDEHTWIGEPGELSAATHTAQAGEALSTSMRADSLERLALAMRVADVFHLRDSGLEDYLLRFKTLGEWVDLIWQVRQQGSRRLTFFTSGSSGQPKACAHAWPNLVAEVEYCAHLFAQTLGQPIQRILALVPCHHIYGCLFSVILADWLQKPVLRAQAALSEVHARRLEAGDLIVAFPFLWKQLARQAQPFPGGVLGLTSTGPCDAQVIYQLRQQGLAAMVELYGASETGGIGVRTDPRQPFGLLPRWQAVDGDTLMESASGEQYPLNDTLSWQDARHFTLGGRLDQAVAVGGINVFPQRIAEKLAALPGVREARVRLMHPQEGDRLKAFILPEPAYADDPEQLIQSLHEWCYEHLSAPERPRVFTLGSHLPTNALGKDSDWRLKEDTTS
ncbi:AMP-binding protein [Thiorhodospira sibirica]|uniref:AMP-binding protein n=1 Tax=Thiorhodospira sibirica TaxID=154347 RepID=UPI00022C1D35|nr:AMP-binding protein [Thiorhodospira sibirica]